MSKKLFYSHWYLDILIISLSFNLFTVRIGWAHGDIPVLIGYGPYFFILGIITACIFSAVNRQNPVLAAIVGMFLGFLFTALVFLLWEVRFFWDNLKLILVGFIIYFIPAILVGFVIGLIFKKLKKQK